MGINRIWMCGRVPSRKAAQYSTLSRSRVTGSRLASTWREFVGEVLSAPVMSFAAFCWAVNSFAVTCTHPERSVRLGFAVMTVYQMSAAWVRAGIAPVL